MLIVKGNHKLCILMCLLCALGGAFIGAITVAIEVRTAFVTIPMWKLDHYTFDYPDYRDGKIHTWQLRDCGTWPDKGPWE